MPINGKKLKLLRVNKNMSRFDLSLELEISPSTIEKIEIGERSGNIETASKLAKFFNVSIDELL
jgi:transcriptional regulator with XRE-family HTH domain